MRSRALALLGAGALGLSAPGAADGVAPAIPATAPPSVVRVDLVGGPGPSLIEVVAWSDDVHADGVAPSATVCVRAERYERWSEQHGDRSVQLRSVTTTDGCGAAGAYGFNHVDWRAEVHAEAATEVETVTSEFRDGTWVEVGRTRTAGPAASVRGRWTGTGASTDDSSLLPPICYSWPPAPCSCWRPGIAASRTADVDGWVTFAGASTPPIAISAVGSMGWRTP